jgi:CRP/FNR family cyclic AMP-dependent transcriptional regulator
MTMDTGDLTTVAVFADLSDEDLDWISQRAHSVEVPIGTHLVSMGDVAYKFFGIVDGYASVSVDGVPVASLGPGECFGEMAVLEAERRTADVVSTTQMKLVTLLAWDLREMAEKLPALSDSIEKVMKARGEL